MNFGHCNQCHDTSTLAKKLEIDLHDDYMNKEEDLSLSRSWKPLARIPKKRKNFSKEK
jgi:hypothetical protein